MKLTSVSNQVESLSTRVDGIISSLTMLGINATDLEAGLMAAQSQLASITAALADLDTSAGLATISATLAEIQADVREILENNSVLTQDITINSVSPLELAEPLI